MDGWLDGCRDQHLDSSRAWHGIKARIFSMSCSRDGMVLLSTFSFVEKDSTTSQPAMNYAS
jgi:hypothetical protein